MSGGEESFLARWSRRKQAEAQTAAEPMPAAAAELPAEQPTPPAEQKPDETFDLSKLPAIESLGKDSDYSMFMHNAVPENLRLQALRRMWATDPMLAAPDLLDMHQWDYTGNDGIKPLVTPALEALAAAARKLAEKAREEAAAERQPPSDSPATEAGAKAEPTDPDRQSSG